MTSAILVGLSIAAFAQLSGIEMMIYCTPTLLTNASFSRDAALHSASGIAAIYPIMTVIGKLIVDRVAIRLLKQQTDAAPGGEDGGVKTMSKVVKQIRLFHAPCT